MSIQFSHCDARIVHRPKTCQVCDGLPDLQEIREAWNINYTGENDPQKQPCPAMAVRDLEVIYKWGGNRAVPHDTKLKKALDFVYNAGYTKIGIWTNQASISELMKSSADYTWNRGNSVLIRKNMNAFIFTIDRTMDLRGRDFEVFIIEGDTADGQALDFIKWTLRLGQVPMRIHI